MVRRTERLGDPGTSSLPDSDLGDRVTTGDRPAQTHRRCGEGRRRVRSKRENCVGRGVLRKFGENRRQGRIVNILAGRQS